MKKIITFLGASPGRPTVYSHQGNHYSGSLFAEALCQFSDYDVMLVCVTEAAKAQNWPILAALNDPRIQAVDIPTGVDSTEMWQTFQVITQQIETGDRVIFDITHGLRSLPFLVFLFAAYLKVAKQVTIEAIYYGALELKDQNQAAPVIDLTEFIEMLDWLTATSRFVDLGNGQALADLLQAASGSPAPDKAAQAIETVSLALQLTRPLEVMAATTALETALAQSIQSNTPRTQPFKLLVKKIVAEYGQFTAAPPDDLAGSLGIQLQMIQWYVQRQQTVQAATLAREWVVSVVAMQLGRALYEKSDREQVESAINNESRRLRHLKIDRPTECDSDFKQLHQRELILTIWQEMAQLRNNIAHCGMYQQRSLDKKVRKRNTASEKRESARSLKERMDAMIPLLIQLFDKNDPSTEATEATEVVAASLTTRKTEVK